MVRNRCSCGAQATSSPLFEIAAGAPAAARSWLMRCPACGSLFPDPWPGSAAAYEDYYTLAARPTGWRRIARRLSEITRRAYLDRATPGSARRILDYGCGDGRYLARMAGADRVCFGVDTTPARGEAAAWTWLDGDAIADAAPLDWITLGHVLEHLDDPAGVLRTLARALSPDGGVWLATPNADSFVFRLAGRWARDVDYPRHREMFSRQGLARLAESAGFGVAWLPAPRLNAVLNLASTLTILRGRDHGRAAARLLAATLLHIMAPRARRQAQSPELVAILYPNAGAPAAAATPPITPPRPTASPRSARSSGPAGRC